jgi:hypothetical protein
MQLDRFCEVLERSPFRSSLARNVDLKALGYEPATLAPNACREFPLSHASLSFGA